MTEVPLEYDIFSDLNLYLVIGLGSVSFLLLITILVTIVLKCQKPKDQERKAGGETASAQRLQIRSVQSTTRHRSDRHQRLCCLHFTGIRQQYQQCQIRPSPPR
ncbi:hypothetical protein WMY93_009656 [Mugilogobius chulae]|uniref:Cadherin cytoplasmic C-terminal domain-containing protein n=1 Tax=Mugilogobius chulae TaxID=88201 RepID=A0AAW0PQS4_9GOBI